MGVRDSMHASTTIPQLDLISCTCGEVDMQIALKWERLDAVDLAIMCRYYANFDILKSPLSS